MPPTLAKTLAPLTEVFTENFFWLYSFAQKVSQKMYFQDASSVVQNACHNKNVNNKRKESFHTSIIYFE